MKLLAGLLLVGVIFAAPSIATPLTDSTASIARAFGNTLLSTYPDGRQARLWLNANGTYSAEGRNHQLGGGRWKLDQNKLCMRQTDPFPIPFRFCTPLQAAAAGTSWQAEAPTGEPIIITLVPGRPADQAQQASN